MQNSIFGLLVALLFAGAGYMTYLNSQAKPTVPQTLSKDSYERLSGTVATETSQSAIGSDTGTQGNQSKSEQAAALSIQLTQIETALEEMLMLGGKLLSTEGDKSGDVSDKLSALDQGLRELLSETARLSAQIPELASRNETLAAELADIRGGYEQKLTQFKTDRNQSVLTADEAKQQMAATNQLLQLKEETLQLEKQKLARLRQDIENLKRSMNLELNEKDSVIQQLKDTSTMVQLGNDVAFRLGSTALSNQGKEVLIRVTELIESYPDYLISLEGHTDDIPISADNLEKYPSNWELSTARAAAAARFLIDRGIDPARLKVTGYGPNRPVAGNDTDQGRARNRRLEILFLPRLPIRVSE